MENEDRVQFPSGAVRGTDSNVPRYELVPLVGIRRAAEACSYGVEVKGYGVGNWTKGIPSSNLLKHALAHVYRYIDGDRSEDHLGHAIWNLMVAAHNEERRPDVHDLDSLRQLPAAADSQSADSSFFKDVFPTEAEEPKRCRTCGVQMLDFRQPGAQEPQWTCCCNYSGLGPSSCAVAQDAPQGSSAFSKRIMTALQKVQIPFDKLVDAGQGRVRFCVADIEYIVAMNPRPGDRARVAQWGLEFISTSFSEELESRLQSAGAWDIPEGVP